MSKNDASGNCTKHMDLIYRLVCDRRNEKKFRLNYCSSISMVADILTQPLGKLLFRNNYLNLELENTQVLTDN